MSPLGTLPLELLVKVLQHVDQQNRLTSCALVSRTWSTAAVAATTSVSHMGFTVQNSWASRQRVSYLQAWMHRHGQQVSSLRLLAWPHQSFDLLEQVLRCCQLQELRLYGFSLKLTECSSQQGPQLLPYYSGLRCLELGSCRFMAGSDGLAALSAMTGLQHLTLRYLHEQDRYFFNCPSDPLSKLVQLTHLQLDGGTLEGSSLDNFSCLTSLRELELRAMKGLATAGALSGLQHLSQLTSLCLSLETPLSLDGSTCGGQWLRQLTALQHLYIYNASLFEPSLLAGMTQLRHLRLTAAALRTHAAGTAALLAALPQLQQLQCFAVESDTLYNYPTTEAALYAGLTASNKLQALDLSGLLLPAAAWQHMFAEGRQLPQLQTLDAHGLRLKSDPPQAGHVGDTAEVPFLRGQDVESLVCCCPKLQQLDINNSVQQGEHVSVLRSLSALTALSYLVISDINYEAAGVLAQLTGLRDLKVGPCVDLTPVGVLKLTALRMLTELHWTPDSDMHLSQLGAFGQQYSNQAEEGHAPDVHLQLLQHCYSIPECQEAIRQQIEDACNKAAAARLAVIEAKLQQKEAELMQAQAEAASLRAQLAQLNAAAEVHVLQASWLQ